MMGCLYAKGIPCITDCEMAETEIGAEVSSGSKNCQGNPRLEQLPCTNKGICADDCLIQRVTAQV